MARPPRVTRTIKLIRAKVLCMNLEDGTSFTKEVTVPARECRGKTGVYKRVCKELDSPQVKAVQIMDACEEEKLMGMLEEDFLLYAKELESRDLKDKEKEEEED